MSNSVEMVVINNSHLTEGTIFNMIMFCLQNASKKYKCIYSDFSLIELVTIFSSIFSIFLYYKLYCSFNPKNIFTLKKNKHLETRERYEKTGSPRRQVG